jgi:hypothetical protein
MQAHIRVRTVFEHSFYFCFLKEEKLTNEEPSPRISIGCNTKTHWLKKEFHRILSYLINRFWATLGLVRNLKSK